MTDLTPRRPTPFPDISSEDIDEVTRRSIAGVLNTPADLMNLYPIISGIPEALTGTALPGADKVSEFTQEYTNRVYDVLGLEAPETPSEWLSEIANPAAIAKLPIKFLNTLPDALRVAEPLMPFVQGPWTASRATMNVAVPFAAQQGLTELVAPEQDTIFGSSQAQAQEVPQEYDLAIPEREEPITFIDERNESGFDIIDVDSWVPIDQQVADREASFDITNPDTWNDIGAIAREKENRDKLILGTVGVLGVIFGAHHVGRLASARRQRLAIERASEFTGEAPRSARPEPSQTYTPTETLLNVNEPIASAARATSTQLVDNLSPITYALNRLKGTAPDVAENVAAHVYTTGNPMAMAKRVDAALKTGALPNSNIRLDVAPATHISKVLSMEAPEIGAYMDLRAAYSMLDDLIIQRYAGKTNPMWGRFNETTLNAKIRALEAQSPRAREMVLEHQNMMRKMLDYAEEGGTLSSAERAAWAFNRPNYSPIGTKFASDPLRAVKRLWGSDMPAMDANILDISKPREANALPGQLKEAHLMDIEYLTNAMKAVETNRLRRMIVESLDNVQYKNGNKLVNIRTRQRAGKPSLKFRDAHGVEKYAEITDPALLSALKFRPNMIGGVLQSAARIAMSFTTGKFNPLFALKSLSYETLAAHPMLKSGRRLGAIDQVLNQIGFKGKLSSFDFTSVAALPVDAGASILRQASLNAANRLRVSAFNNGILARALGPDNAEALARVMQRSYENSAYGLYEHYGGGNGVFIETDTFARPESVGKSIPELARLQGANIASSIIGRSYNMILEGIHNAVRFRHMSANVRRKITMVPDGQGGTRLPRFGDYGATGRLANIPFIQYEPLGDISHLNNIKQAEAQLKRAIATNDTAAQAHITNTIIPTLKEAKFQADNRNMTSLAADTRNLTGDVTRKPGDPSTLLGRNVQRGIGQTMYGNHFIQITAQIARMVKDHPFRLGTTLAVYGTGVVTAYHYAFREAEEDVAAMTPDQRMRTIPIAFDGKIQYLISVPPELRLFTGPLVESYLNVGGLLNEQFANRSLTVEEAMARRGLAETLWSSLSSDIIPDPLGPGIRAAYTAGTGLAAFQGSTDTPSTLPRMFEGNRGATYTPPKEEFRTLADRQENALEDTGRLLVQELIAGSAEMVLDSVDTLSTALGDENDIVTATALGLEAATVRDRTTVKPLLGIDERVNLTDPVSSYVRQSQAALRALEPIVNQGVIGGGDTFSLSRPMIEDIMGRMPSLREHEAVMFINYVKQAQWQLRPLNEQYTVLKNRKSQIDRNPYLTVSDKQRILNEISLEQRELNKQMFRFIKIAEDETATMLGREFSFATESIQ